MSPLVNRLKQNFPASSELTQAHSHLVAVVVIIHETKSKPHILLILRSKNLKRHCESTAFTDGAYDLQYSNLPEIALRKIKEEIDMVLEESLVTSRLPDVITLTVYETTPFIDIINNILCCDPNPEEVDEIFDISQLNPLLRTQTPDRAFHSSPNMVNFCDKQNRVWEATEKILKQMMFTNSH